MQPARLLLINLLWAVLTLAQDQYGISENFFSLNKGLDAAKLAAPYVESHSLAKGVLTMRVGNGTLPVAHVYLKQPKMARVIRRTA